MSGLLSFRFPDVPELILGTLSRNISRNLTVDYQINATANTGDFGALNGTFHICDHLEKMHQPPGSNVPEVLCPPSKGPIFIDYAAYFVDFLVAPVSMGRALEANTATHSFAQGQWSVKFDAKTEEGVRVYCLQAEFDLQCPPWHEGPECLRNTSGVLDIGGRMELLRKRLIVAPEG